MTNSACPAGAITQCQSCGAAVPAAAFCQRCGARLDSRQSDGPKWLRLRQFAAAPTEGVLRPAITSTLFPGLSRSSHRRFQAALAVAAGGLVILAVLRVAPAVIAVGALGIPLLFALYLRECGAVERIPRRLLVGSAVLGAGLGVAATLATGQLVAQSYEISVAAGMAVNRFLRHGIVFAFAAALLKTVPAFVGRALSRPPREVLDGFAIGTLGALAFVAAAILTRLAPQFALGAVASRRPLAQLIIEAGICGLTVPLTAAAAGGTVGVALWFTPRGKEAPASRRRARGCLAALAAAVVMIFVGVVVTDVAGLAQLKVLALHLALSVASVLVLRLALQVALLHEAVGPRPAQSVCSWCGTAVDDGRADGAAYCPVCGAAAVAASVGAPARARQPRTLGRLLGLWALGNAGLAAALVGLSVIVTAKPAHYTCPPDCGRPPIGTPVIDLPRYTAPDGSFSVAYPPAGTAYQVAIGADGVSARWTAGDGGVLRLFSEPACGRTPRAIAIDLLAKKFPDAGMAYEIPNAMVGYQLGYGEAADRWPLTATGAYLRLRILILVAVKNDLALVAAAVGPYREFTPDSGPGPPSGANLQIAQDMGKYVNSFRWKGDPLN